jgi:hypothetical protein
VVSAAKDRVIVSTTMPAMTWTASALDATSAAPLGRPIYAQPESDRGWDQTSRPQPRRNRAGWVKTDTAQRISTSRVAILAYATLIFVIVQAARSLGH